MRTNKGCPKMLEELEKPALIVGEDYLILITDPDDDEAKIWIVATYTYEGKFQVRRPSRIEVALPDVHRILLLPLTK